MMNNKHTVNQYKHNMVAILRGGINPFSHFVRTHLPPREPICRCRVGKLSIELHPSIDAAIADKLRDCLVETDLSWGSKRKGKVRDTYDLGDKLLIVTTDRLSAFDRLLASIPFKGQVLNQTSAWWFKNTTQIVPNGVVSIPDPNVTIMEKVDVFPVEFVVRGYMTGSTDTSLWTHYNSGDRVYCGIIFQDGMRKNDKLPENVITPTSKSDMHDELTSPQQILEDGIMTEEDWNDASSAALDLFKYGQEEALKRGLILVDTKYEFGKNSMGKLMLVDEVHTPDSSRYWIADSYEQRHSMGEEPDNIDKEFLRLWFRENCDPYNDKVLPQAPAELVTELSKRYIFLYERITGESFTVPTASKGTNERMISNLMDIIHMQ